MKITVLFFHQGQFIKLEVKYAPELDKSKQEGIWDVDNNRVALSWRMFKDFKDERDHSKRKKLLESVHTVSVYQMKQKNSF